MVRNHRLTRRQREARHSYQMAFAFALLGVLLVGISVTAICNLAMEYRTADILSMFAILGFMGLMAMLVAVLAVNDANKR